MSFKQKPTAWNCDPGIVACNCAQMGLPPPTLAMPFWEGTGNTTYDYSGNNKNGAILSDIAWKASSFGTHLNSPGSAGDGVDVGDFPRNFVSISVAIGTIPKAAGSWDRVIQRANTDGWGFNFRTIASTFLFQDRHFNATANARTDNAYTQGQIYHLVGTCDGVALKLYSNGVLQTDTLGDGGSCGGGSDLEFFKRANAESNFYTGGLLYVYIFPAALNSTQVQILNNNMCGMFEPTRTPAIWKAAAAGGLSMPIAMHHYNQLRLG